MSFDDGFMLGLSLGGGGGGSGGGDEDWTPPEDWLPVPEPGAYEICLLIEVKEVSTRYGPYLSLTLCRPEDSNTGYGPLAIDWGDGIKDHWAGSEYGDSWSWRTDHYYEQTGQYVVKITTTENSCYWIQTSPSGNVYAKMLIAKLGDEIIVSNGDSGGTQNAFSRQHNLHYVKLNGKGGLPYYGAFNGDYSLRRVDIKTPPEIIPKDAFNYCFNLKKFDFSEVIRINDYGLRFTGFPKLNLPKCTSIGQYGINNNYTLSEINAPLCTEISKNGIAYNYSLKKLFLPICRSLGVQSIYENHSLDKIELPECTSVGQYGISSNYRLLEIHMPECLAIDLYGLANNYALNELEVADGCTFGANSFTSCYCLYPRPDGSTN